tara:strand:- start:986 stop:2611 length:1626 start_codon:yes stop_codon:yes gene_type:complete
MSCCFTLLNTTRLYSQSDTDSLTYYRNLALQPQNPNDLFNAFRYFDTNYSNAVEQNDSDAVINSLYYKASIEYKQGMYDDSEETAVKAISVLDNIDYSHQRMEFRKSLYNLLGMVYSEKMNKSKVLELYGKSFEIAENTNDSIIIHNNISLVYKDNGDFEKAKNELLKAYKKIPRNKDPLITALIWDNLGFIYSELNDKRSLPLMMKALELRESVNATFKIHTSYKHLAKHFNKTNNSTKANQYANMAYTLANELNSPSYRLDALSLLVDLKNYEFVDEFKSLSDSLVLTKKQNQNKFMLFKYDDSVSKRIALESQLDEEEQRNLKLIYLSTAIIILLFAILLYSIQKSKHKKEKLQQVFDTESRISKQIHDEVANDVFQVMIKLENENQEHEGLINELHSLYHRTRDISQEHSAINTDYPFVDHLSELIESFNDTYTSVIIKGISEIAWNNISELNRITIYKVVQELLINMKKHSQATLVVILFKKENKNIQINYSDNGIGSELKKHTGLQNTENRILSINGTITFETHPNKGFKAKIRV